MNAIKACTKDVKIIATLFACIFPLNGSAVRRS
jgi:hypothetical protein